MPVADQMEPTSQQIQELKSNFIKKLNENGGETGKML